MLRLTAQLVRKGDEDDSCSRDKVRDLCICTISDAKLLDNGALIDRLGWIEPCGSCCCVLNLNFSILNVRVPRPQLSVNVSDSCAPVCYGMRSP